MLKRSAPTNTQPIAKFCRQVTRPYVASWQAAYMDYKRPSVRTSKPRAFETKKEALEWLQSEFEDRVGEAGDVSREDLFDFLQIEDVHSLYDSNRWGMDMRSPYFEGSVFHTESGTHGTSIKVDNDLFLKIYQEKLRKDWKRIFRELYKDDETEEEAAEEEARVEEQLKGGPNVK